MITYNHAPYIGHAIESILAQDLDEPFELIVGEDCSTDGTLKIVNSYRARYPDVIRVITGPENVGMNENLRRIAMAARSEFIAFCEGGDVWHNSKKLALQLSIIRSAGDIGMVYSDYDRAIQVIGRWRRIRGVVARSRIAPAEGEAFEDLLDRIQVHLSTMLCRASVVREYFESDLFDPSLRLGDVPLLLFCAARACVAYLPVSTSMYRPVPNSSTNRSRGHLLRIVQDQVAVVHRFEEQFGSNTGRRATRLARLDAMVASAAYAAGDIQTYSALAPSDRKVRLRRFLMRLPFLHHTDITRVAALQRIEFLKVSEDAAWLN